MSQGGHRISITLRSRNRYEAELWEKIQPMLKRKRFNGYVVNLLIEELVLDERERKARRYFRQLFGQMVWQGKPGAETANLKELITAGMTAVEGNFVEIEPEKE